MDIGFQTGLRFWRYMRIARFDELTYQDPWRNRFEHPVLGIELATRHSIESTPPTCSTIADLGTRNGFWLDGPVELMVSRQGSRRTIPGAIIHSCSSLGRTHFFHRHQDDVFIACPELCCLQVMDSHDMIGSLRMLSELAGFYALGDATAQGLAPMSAAVPAISADSVAMFIKDIEGHDVRYPLERLRQWGCNLIERSASPRETDLALMLTLPYRHGGYALPKPELNVPIDLDRIPGSGFHGTYYADLIWGDRKLIVEYDSDGFHTGAERINRDAIRRNVLEHAGFNVVTVTNGQFKDHKTFDETARIIARFLGKEPRRVPLDWPKRSRGLFEALRRPA